MQIKIMRHHSLMATIKKKKKKKRTSAGKDVVKLKHLRTVGRNAEWAASLGNSMMVP